MSPYQRSNQETLEGTKMDQNWDHEAGLVVIGYGAAGAAAAITASHLGASVILVEKQSQQSHTPNIAMSGGMFMTLTDVEQGAKYLTACAGGIVPETSIQALAKRAAGLVEWLHKVVPDLPITLVNHAEHPDFPGANAVDVYQTGHARFKMDFEAGTGRTLFAALSKVADQKKIPILWEAPARRLIRTANGVVVGAIVETREGPKRVRARRGVLLTCGGFEYDEMAKLNYLGAPMYFYGNPGNSGDGLRMAQDVGADLWHMNLIVGRAIGNFPLPSGTNQAFFMNVAPAGYVITDRYGKRFSNEDAQAQLTHSFYFDLLQFDPERGIYPRIPCYWFFDERRRKAGPLSPIHIGACGVGIYDWSTDNKREIESGWIFRGNSIREVAERAGVEDPTAAEHTIHTYNKTCSSGMRDPFGRAVDSMIPIAEPPYYCVKLWPGGSNTTGGPRRDHGGRVLDVFGEPIRGLFAAGELGQISGTLYPADGFNLCEAFCFGQIAAETALASAHPPK
jgi:succinate dehydrogenase/fumarate reductase flavoprotein subunit